MLDLISGLIVLAIFLAFVTPWIRSIAGRSRRPVSGRPVSRGPRDLAESGGYRQVLPARRETANRFPVADRAEEEDAPVLLKRSATVPIDATPQSTFDTRSVRRALATPESLRTAIILKEIMDPPISMKEHG